MTQPIVIGSAGRQRDSRRVLVLIGVGVALLLTALVLPRLLFGGGGDTGGDELLTAPPVATGAPAPVVPLPTGPNDVPGPDQPVTGIPAPETFEVFSTKNPFTPLASLSPTGEETSTGGSTPVAPTPVEAGPATGSATPVPVPTEEDPDEPPAAVTPTPSAGSGSVEPRPMQRIAVLEVFVDEAGQRRASVRVNDTVHDVAEGQAFATSYQVVALSEPDGCGQFLYGDDRFRACEGEELLK